MPQLILFHIFYLIIFDKLKMIHTQYTFISNTILNLTLLFYTEFFLFVMYNFDRAISPRCTSDNANADGMSIFKLYILEMACAQDQSG